MQHDGPDEPVVYLVPSAGLRGELVENSDEENVRTVYKFLGVPYAEPPIGYQRFRDPSPLKLWNGIRDARQFGAACPQNFALLKSMPFPVPNPSSVSEDCLFLNIWTPSLDPAARLPVMFWIHGGGFICGFSDFYGGETLASTKDVVIVTINYRLGPLGFLCTNDSSATGNYGILDQIEALKWVQKYIGNFGGDPDNVTIFGESAGAVSVSLLVVSPVARGLFRRAIAESGSVFCGNLGASPPEKVAQNLLASTAKKFPDGPPASATRAEIVEFLRQLPVDEIVGLSEEYVTTGFVVIDGRVLPSSPLDIYTSAEQNHVELLTGCNSDEGENIVVGMTEKFGLNLELLDVATTRSLMETFLSVFFSFPNVEEVVLAVIEQYTGDVDSTTSNEDLHRRLAEFFGDVLHVSPMIETANYHSRASKTFVYFFCHRPAYAVCPESMKADHAAELAFILDIPKWSSELSVEDKELSRQMRSYWTNFAKTGNPNGEGLVPWPEYNETTKEHILLHLPVKPGSKLKEHRADFWLRQMPELVRTIGSGFS